MSFVGHLYNNEQAYLKYLKARNVKNANEVLLLVLRVEGLVNASDQPVEHSHIDGFCQCRHSVDDLYSVRECDTSSEHSLRHKRTAGDSL